MGGATIDPGIPVSVWQVGSPVRQTKSYCGGLPSYKSQDEVYLRYSIYQNYMGSSLN